MIKQKEIEDHTSCLNKAEIDEPIFVLRAKDPQSIPTVLEWVKRRIESGKNSILDPKIQEALEWCGLAADWTTSKNSKDVKSQGDENLWKTNPRFNRPMFPQDLPGGYWMCVDYDGLVKAMSIKPTLNHLDGEWTVTHTMDFVHVTIGKWEQAEFAKLRWAACLWQKPIMEVPDVVGVIKPNWLTISFYGPTSVGVDEPTPGITDWKYPGLYLGVNPIPLPPTISWDEACWPKVAK